MHFTHINNLPGIMSASAVHADSLVDRTTALRVEAADLDIKATRKRAPVRVAPFGYVGDYVPFYFAPRSPMLYKLAQGSVASYTGGQEPLIYLVSTVEAVAATGATCLFSDGNCAARITQVFDDLTLLDSAIDWPLMRSRWWNNTAADPDRKRRRSAEFLVYQGVTIRCLTEIAVRSAIIKQTVENMLAPNRMAVPVRIRPSWYYD